MATTVYSGADGTISVAVEAGPAGDKAKTVIDKYSLTPVGRATGVTVRVTNIARTVADCFKFRNKIGLDVAMEALQEAWRAKRVSMDELWRYATLCRVANVMRPYMESLS